MNALDTLTALPGEESILPWTPARGPVTNSEALGVARRHARAEIKLARPNSQAVVPDELPSSGARRRSHLFRLPARTMSFVKARAEMEGRTITDVIEQALIAYANGTPDSPENR